MKRYLSYIVIFAAGFALAQLTRSVDYEHAIGFSVRAFWEAMGAGLALFAMGLGAMTLFHMVMDSAERLAPESVLRRLQKTEAR